MTTIATNCCYCFCYFTPSKFFLYTRVSWWVFTEGWETASLLRSPELIRVFWPISSLLLSECSLFVLRFPTLPDPLKTVPSVPTTIGITTTLMFHIFLVLWQGLTTRLSFHFLLFSLCVLLERQNPLDDSFFSLFC